MHQKKKFFLQNCMNWNILQRSKIFHFWWKIFHFGEIFFSASGPSRLPNCIPEGRCGNFSTLVKLFFRHLDLLVSQTASQMEDVENFPPKVENFPLQKNFLEKKIFILKSLELEHSAEVEIFPLLVEKFPLWRNFVFGF